jgi:aldose 1-epimerase
MFSIIREDFFGIEKIKIIDSTTGAYVAILPEWGANVNELVLQNKGALHSIVAGDASLESLHGTPGNFYRGAKLSPFPNRVEHGKYSFQDHVHELDRNDGIHALHGLVWDLPFRVIHEESASDFAEVELTYDYISNYMGYPFTYSISILYRLESSQLFCYTTIHNTGNTVLPIGDGWHPYFSVNDKVDSLKLKLPACNQLEMGLGIPTGKYVVADFLQDAFLLQDQILDHCFELIAAEGIVVTELIAVDADLKLIVWQEVGDKGYNFFKSIYRLIECLLQLSL